MSALIGNIIKARPDYDYIIIDSKSSLGLLTLNVIVAARSGIIIPINLDALSGKALGKLVETIGIIQQNLLSANILHMGIAGLVFTPFSDGQMMLDKANKYDLTPFLPLNVFKTHIPESVYARKALRSGVLYSQWDKQAWAAYDSLATEIDDCLANMDEKGPRIVDVVWE